MMDDLAAKLFYLPDLVVNMVGALTIQMVLFYLVARILPPRSARAYYGVGLACSAVILFLKPVMPPFFRVVGNSVLVWGLPAFMLKGSLALRLVVPAVGILAETAGEVVGMLFWVGLTGLGKVDNAVLLQHWPAYLLGFAFGSIGTMALIMQGAKVVAERLGLVSSGVDGDAGGEGRPWPLRYAWFVAVQLVLMTVVTLIGLDYLDWGGGSVMVAALLFALCFVADAVLFAQIGRAVDQEVQEARSRMLESQVKECLSDAAGLQSLLDDTARLRHDMRNHRMIVETLCSRGEHGRAEAYLEEISARIGLS